MQLDDIFDSTHTKIPPTESLEEQLVARITAILISLRAALAQHRSPEITLVSRRTTQLTLYTVSFPGPNEYEAEKFAISTLLLSTTRYPPSTDQVVTKCDMFYQHLSEIETQLIIDHAVDHIAVILEVPRNT